MKKRLFIPFMLVIVMVHAGTCSAGLFDDIANAVIQGAVDDITGSAQNYKQAPEENPKNPKDKDAVRLPSEDLTSPA